MFQFHRLFSHKQSVPTTDVCFIGICVNIIHSTRRISKVNNRSILWLSNKTAAEKTCTNRYLDFCVCAQLISKCEEIVLAKMSRFTGFESTSMDYYCSRAISRCHFPSQHGLTQDESAVIFLYTMEWDNNDIRSNNQCRIESWFTYLKLFNTAIQKLATVKRNLWRGVPKNISREFRKLFMIEVVNG